MTNEQLRMQLIGGIITESEYKAKIEENKSPKNKKPLTENFVGMGAINNPFPEREKSDYELAFEHFTKGGLNEDESLEGLDEDKKTLPSSAHHIAKQVIESGEFIIIDKPTSLNLKVDDELLGTYNGMFYHITKVKGKGKDRIYTIADDSFGDEEEIITSDLRKYFLLDKR
jgi:hypothetical protein